MKKLFALVCIVGIHSCDLSVPDYDRVDCDQYFTEFNDLRVNIYFDNSDDSYLSHQGWKGITNRLGSTSNRDTLDLQVEPLNSDESYKLVFPKESEFHFYDFDTIFLSYGNGDFDSITFSHHAISDECGEIQWIDNVRINTSDTLDRDEDGAFAFFKN